MGKDRFSDEASEMMQQIANDVEALAAELVTAGKLSAGQLIVIGASTSEVAGQRIGTSGTEGIAACLYQGLERVKAQYAVEFAFQCCEHLNRALVVEQAYMERSGLEQVSVIPVPGAGGAMAAYAYRQMKSPCVVEAVRAHAGIDIGDTFIGMHLRPVAVPVRPVIRTIGAAHVTMAYSRPKLIGGARAVYTMQIQEDSTSCDK